MAFFKNLVSKIKEVFTGESDDYTSEADSLAKQNISNYQSATQPTAKPVVKQDTPQTTHTATAAKPTVTEKPSAPVIEQMTMRINAKPAVELTPVSDVVEHTVVNPQLSRLDVLIDALDLERRKIVQDNNVVVIPFDASGCDFDTKRQLGAAAAEEFGLDYHIVPSGIGCSELAKKVFSCLRGAREECFACGAFFLSTTTDIDSEGYLTAELTNITNGNSVFFDIPAEIQPDGSLNVDYDLIYNNIMISRSKVSKI